VVTLAGPSNTKKCNKSDRRRIIIGGSISMIAPWCCTAQNDDSGHNTRHTQQRYTEGMIEFAAASAMLWRSEFGISSDGSSDSVAANDKKRNL